VNILNTTFIFGADIEKNEKGRQSDPTPLAPACFCKSLLVYAYAQNAGRCAVAAAGLKPKSKGACSGPIEMSPAAQRLTWRCQAWL